MRLFKVFLFICFICAFFSPNSFSKIKPRGIKPVQDFSFIDQNGHAIANSDLRDSLWIANFIFTRCQEMCPLITGKIAALQEKFKNQDIKFVSFSVDPEYDTSEVLSKYADSHKAISGKWFFLTTNQRQKMWDFIMTSFMLGVGEPTEEDVAQGAEPVMHSSRFVLVDGGNIIGYYDSNEPTQMEALVEEVAYYTDRSGD